MPSTIQNRDARAVRPYLHVGMIFYLELDLEGFGVVFGFEDEDIDAGREIEIALGSLCSRLFCSLY